jgi:hypothetical protein
MLRGTTLRGLTLRGTTLRGFALRGFALRGFTFRGFTLFGTCDRRQATDRSRRPSGCRCASGRTTNTKRSEHHPQPLGAQRDRFCHQNGHPARSSHRRRGRHYTSRESNGRRGRTSCNRGGWKRGGRDDGEDTRRARGKCPYRAKRGKGGGRGRGGCSSHIGNGEQCATAPIVGAKHAAPATRTSAATRPRTEETATEVSAAAAVAPARPGRGAASGGQVELTKQADWDSMSRPPRKKWKKNRAQHMHLDTSSQASCLGMRSRACVARAKKG